MSEQGKSPLLEYARGEKIPDQVRSTVREYEIRPPRKSLTYLGTLFQVLCYFDNGLDRNRQDQEG